MRPNAKEKAKNEKYLNENVVICGIIAQLPGECNLCNVSEQAWIQVTLSAKNSFLKYSIDGPLRKLGLKSIF